MSATGAKNIDVSVVIPAYNAGRTIYAAVRSVLQQEGVTIEVLVGDDASTDDTFQQLSLLRDTRLRTFQMPHNCGAGAVRDYLVDNAHGDYIAFLDADDCFVQTRLAELLQVARSFPGTIVFDDIYECHDLPNRLAPFRKVHGRLAFRGINYGTAPRRVTLRQLMLARRLLVKPLIPTRQLRETGVRHTIHRYGEDGLFLWRLLARGVPAVYFPKPLYQYRITPGSLSANRGRVLLLADCFAQLLAEDLTPQDRKLVTNRERDCRDYAEMRAVKGKYSPLKVHAILKYFLSSPNRLPKLFFSYFRDAQYRASNRKSGAPRR